MSRTLGEPFLVGGHDLKGTRAPAFMRGKPKGGGPKLSPPAQMMSADWALEDAETGETLRLEILSAPDDLGSSIIGYEYSVDDGAWDGAGLSAPGTIKLSGLADGVAVAVRVRAANAAGPGLASAPRIATPTAAVPGFALEGRPGAILIGGLPDVVAPRAQGQTNSLQITDDM